MGYMRPHPEQVSVPSSTCVCVCKKEQVGRGLYMRLVVRVIDATCSSVYCFFVKVSCGSSYGVLYVLCHETKHTHTHTCPYSCTHTCSCTHTYINTHIQTHTYKHTLHVRLAGRCAVRVGERRVCSRQWREGWASLQRWGDPKA